MSFYSEKKLKDIGLGSYGDNVLISEKSSIYFPEKLHLGSNVRIDDFTIVSAKGGVKIGNFVHIGAFSAIYGGSGVVLEDYSGMSPRCTIFTESDDFSGESLIHPFFTRDLKSGYQKGEVRLGRFVQLGALTSVMPGCVIGEGSVTGAHSLVLKTIGDWGIYFGVPVARIRDRSRKILDFVASQ